MRGKNYRAPNPPRRPQMCNRDDLLGLDGFKPSVVGGGAGLNARKAARADSRWQPRRLRVRLISALRN
jgi:hypothetical protein